MLRTSSCCSQQGLAYQYELHFISYNLTCPFFSHDYPVVPDDSRAVVTLLRANLAFDSIGAEAEGGEALTLDALKAGLRFQPW